MVLALVKRHEEVADLLLEARADVDSVDPKGGMTAVHAAALNGLEGIMRKLIAGGANLTVAFGQPPVTPLALAFRQGHSSIARLLIEAGADPNVSISAIDLTDARGHEEIVKYLRDNGAVPSPASAARPKQ